MTPFQTVMNYSRNKLAYAGMMMNEKENSRQRGKQTKEVSEKTKEGIMKAALLVFAREGFFNAKLREMAEIAGVSHSLIRHHFGSKEELWRAVVDDGLQFREDNLLALVENNRDMEPVELFKLFVASHIRFVATNVELAKLLLYDNTRNAPHLSYIIEKQKIVHQIAEPVFRQVQEKGYWREFNHDSFTVYMRALTETPLATSEFTNMLCREDILTEEGLQRHIDTCINFLFCEK